MFAVLLWTWNRRQLHCVCRTWSPEGPFHEVRLHDVIRPHPNHGRGKMNDGVSGRVVFMLNASGHIASWNVSAQNATLYAALDAVGKHFSLVFCEDGGAIAEDLLAAAAAEDRADSCAWQFRKDGSKFWSHIVVHAVRDLSDHLTGFAVICRDLTDSRNAEVKLRGNEEQFRLLVEGVVDYAIFMIDRNGRVMSWNPGAERIKGFTAEEILGKPISTFYTDEDRALGEPGRLLQAAASEGKSESLGWRVRKDGSRFWASVVIDAIRDSDGELIGFAKVTRDVTEARAAQFALEQARMELFQLQKMEALGRLTGGIAHDFNNLLMAIRGSLELLNNRVARDTTSGQLLKNAMDAAERGTTLTKRMLAFARNRDLKTSAIDMAALVEAMRDLLERSIGPHIRLELKASPNVPLVIGEPNEIELAILNLAINARDAMLDGGRLSLSVEEVVVDTAASVKLPPGRYVRLSVSDSGAGMDEATVAKASEPFFTTKSIGKGTGLGLSMVHGLAEQLSGRMIVRSKVGEGTTVEFWLPVAAADAVAVPTAGDAQAAAAELQEEPSACTILAVDDDGLVMLSTSMMLQELGHQVIEASSGPKALAALEQHGGAVDLVITDQAMPEMTGLQLAAAIQERWPEIPVIIATGYSDPDHEAFRAHLKIDKPFGQGDLAAAIEATLAR